MPRNHPGDIDRAAAGSDADGWIDLSKGINRSPWPVPALPEIGDDPTAMDRLVRAAAERFGCLPAQVLAVGCPAMRPVPRLWPPGRASVMAPGCIRHAATLRAAGWQVARAGTVEAMEGADLAILANPGDPDGREWHPEALARLARRVGHLVVDESLADARPDLSLAPALPANALVLRSLRPLWGLRLGVVLAHPALLDRLSDAPADARALHVAALALADRPWADDAILYHAEAALRLDRIAIAAGWRFAGGTHLFRLYDTGDALAAQDRLARAHIRARRCSPGLLRLGIPATRDEWDRLSAALRKN
ncbi:threonine-phosphate decarboxylase [Paracoccus sp. YIM 132242]|uniref:Threonine-phosphate decarboxylase n=1 Tax=Paracoccus lichenicola TaxID=2665644 RepID=A0A6L6HIF7_9RHOB|nr:threonine-phosphate decarboxylase [Paracoccus lichenicola]MTD98936.1 threonine-phosphate decarboxylase [Paracoccus lichenicola]